jgi:RNA polymerase sigma-70 factor (ECF subfamily)
MSDSPEATELFVRWQQGDQDAAQHLFELYSTKLTGLAENHLSERLARRLDGEDIVQSVFRSFFHRSSRGEFNIRCSTDLWQLLVRITLTKVCDKARRHTAAKRDMRAEIKGAEPWMLEAFTREPGPVEAATLVDQIETILEGLPDKYGEILAMRLEGRPRTEIAEEHGISRQTVSRALVLLQQRLERTLDDAI